MKLTFIGMGGHSGNLIDICNLQGHDISGFIDDKIEVSDYPKLDKVDACGVLGFGGLSPELLEERYNTLLYSDAYFKTLTHPDAIISPSALFGDGVQVMAGAIIQYNVQIDSACIINTGAIVEHNSIVHKGCHIAPRATILGECEIGEFSFIGAGAIVIQGSKIPPRTFVKAGSIWK